MCDTNPFNYNRVQVLRFVSNPCYFYLLSGFEPASSICFHLEVILTNMLSPLPYLSIMKKKNCKASQKLNEIIKLYYIMLTTLSC